MAKIAYFIAAIALIGTMTAFVQVSNTRNLQATADGSVADLWEAWKSQYGKMYASPAEEAHAFATF